MEAHIGAIIHLAVEMCSTYTFPEDEYFDAHHQLLLEKHGKNGEVKIYTKDITYKTPLIVEILNSRGAFSIGYLQAAYNAYKILKHKNESAIDDLDKLLGI
ncbi:hypothetical protein D3C78_1512170 [compost metagenome]